MAGWWEPRAVVVEQRVVDQPQASAGGTRIDLSKPRDVSPEGDDVSALMMRACVDFVRRRDDWRTRPRGMPSDMKFPDHVVRPRPLRKRDSARDARHNRVRGQVHEDMPRLPEDDRPLTAQAVSPTDGHRGGNRAH